MASFDFPPPLTVGQLAEHITTLVRTDIILSDIAVSGEISNFVRAKSGHLYFSIKDARAAISCVMWRTRAARLFEMPREGQRMIIRGHVDFYAPRGQLQFIVEAMTPEGGIGDLYRRFEALKQALAAEGLFDEARKRPLPALPGRIAVVTSATGAALRDILRVMRQRWPLADVLVAPSLVQGAEAPAALQAALHQLYHRQDIDVIILARGGGSIEDLWAFNDEGVARLVAQSPVPVVSGVGHETDFTIVDFVADHRAPTPSAAAAAVTPDRTEMQRQLTQYQQQLQGIMVSQLTQHRLAVERAQAVVRRHAPLYRIDQQRLLVDELGRRLATALKHRLQRQRLMLDNLSQRLAALNPNAVLARGYALVQDEGGQIIRSVKQTYPGQSLKVTVADGAFGAQLPVDDS